MTNTPVGVDIGEHSVKIAAIGEVNGLHCITNKETYYMPLDDQNFEIGKWIKSCVKSFLKENRIKWASISFSLPYEEPKSIYKILEIPKTNKKEFMKSLPYEIEEKMVISNMEEVFYKWGMLEKQESNNIVLVSVMHKKLVSSLRKIANVFIKIETIEPQILSIGRMVEENSIVVDFGYKSTRIVAYREGRPFYFSSINVGGYHLTKQIAENYKELYLLSEEDRDIEAEKIKMTQAAILNNNEEIEKDPDIVELSNILQETITNLIKEIKSRERALEIKENFEADKLYYTGNSAKLKYFLSYLRKDTQKHFVPLSLGYLENEADIEEDHYSYAIAVGAALYKKHPYIQSINFNKIPVRIKFDRKKIFLGILVFTLLGNLAIGGIHKKYDSKINFKTDSISKQQEIIGELDMKISEKAYLVQAFESKMNTITYLGVQKKWLSDILYEIPERTPSGIALNEIIIEDDLVKIKGFSKNYSDIGFFGIALEDLGAMTIEKVSNLIDSEESNPELNGEPAIEAPAVTELLYLDEIGDLLYSFDIVIEAGGI